MKGIDGGYKLSELLFGKGGSADAIVNVAAEEFRFWAVVFMARNRRQLLENKANSPKGNLLFALLFSSNKGLYA